MAGTVKKVKILRRRRRKPVSGSTDGTVYTTPEYKRWRDRVFHRDRHTCRLCGAKNTYIEAHHILRKVDFPHLIHHISNGITLCKRCHKSITGKEYKFVPLFQELLVKKSKPPDELPI